MKKYLADVLTASRAISAVILIVLVYLDAPSEYALWTFVFGQLTDAFDGIAARRWPFPPGRTPRYRRYAELYDMVIDVALGLSGLAYVTRISPLCGCVMTAVIVLLGAVVELAVWGRLFGAPERCRAHCLWHANRDCATSLVLLRRKFYLVAIGTTICIMLFATRYGIFTKIALIGTAVAVALVLFLIKKDRLNEVKTK